MALLSKPKTSNRRGPRANYCAICGNLNKSDTKFHAFQVPAAKLPEWQKIVSGLTASSRLCSLHFEEQHLKKGRVIQDTFYPYQKWSLTEDAVPKLLLGNKSRYDYFMLHV